MSMFASVEAVLYPVVCRINEYLSNYILVFLLIGVGLWYTVRTGFVQIRFFGEGMRKVFGNLMVDVVATNEKLHVRQVNIVKNATGCNAEQAEAALIACERNCKTAIVMVLKDLGAAEAKKRLDQHGGFIRQVLDKE